MNLTTRIALAAGVIALTAAAGCSRSTSGGSNTSATASAGGGSSDSASPLASGASSTGAADLGIGNPTPALCAGGKTYTIGYDVFSDTQDYVKSLNQSLTATAKQIGGCVTFVTLVDNIDAATAVANVKTFIQRKVDAVLLFQAVASAQPGIMSLLNAAHIPAVATAIPAPGAPFVSPSDKEAGQIAANALISAYKKLGTSTCPWVVLGTEPSVGQSSTDRVASQAGTIEKAIPCVKSSNVIDVDNKGTPDDAYDQSINVISKLPKNTPLLVSGINDDVVGAIVRAMDQHGLGKNVLAVGIGGLYPSGITNVCTNSEFVGTVDFRPDQQGPFIVPVLLAQIRHQPVPSTIDTAIKLLTKADVPQRFPGFTC